jgi:glutathione S-transferase
MSLVLYGSKPSPYVRRIRMLLHGREYKFSPLNVYNDQDRANYAKLTPLRKMPILVDGDVTIYDSHVITSYLIEKFDLPSISYQQHNLLSGIDAVMDSLIVLFMAKNSGLDPNEDRMVFNLQRERLPDCLDWLSEQAKLGAFKDWNYPSMCLVAMLDWIAFRDMWDLSAYHELHQVRDRFAGEPEVGPTMPEPLD